jgi:hypothetical protein
MTESLRLFPPRRVGQSIGFAIAKIVAIDAPASSPTASCLIYSDVSKEIILFTGVSRSPGGNSPGAWWRWLAGSG